MPLQFQSEIFSVAISSCSLDADGCDYLALKYYSSIHQLVHRHLLNDELTDEIKCPFLEAARKHIEFFMKELGKKING